MRHRIAWVQAPTQRLQPKASQAESSFVPGEAVRLPGPARRAAGAAAAPGPAALGPGSEAQAALTP